VSVPCVNVMPCGRRAGALYPPPSGRYFGCHHGHDLTYRLARGHDTRLDAFRRNPELFDSLSRGVAQAA